MTLTHTGTCRYEDENDTVIVHTVQPTEPVGIDQVKTRGNSQQKKINQFDPFSRQLTDPKPTASRMFRLRRFITVGFTAKELDTRLRSLERAALVGRPHCPATLVRACMGDLRRSRAYSSPSPCTGTDNIDGTDDIDDQLPIVLVFETTGPIDIQTSQQAHVSIENIALNKFKVCGRILDCCKLLDTLRQKQSRSPRMSSKTIPIKSQDQWDRVVGTKGCVHKAIMKLSGAKVKINNSESYPKMCTIRGFHGQVAEAEKLIERALKGDDIVTETTPENILACLKKDLEMYGAFKFLTES